MKYVWYLGGPNYNGNHNLAGSNSMLHEHSQSSVFTGSEHDHQMVGANSFSG